jgi:hypothetical protein
LTEASTTIALYILTIGLTLLVLSLLGRLTAARRKLTEMTTERDHHKSTAEAARTNVSTLCDALVHARKKYPTHPQISREHADESNNPP